MLIKFRRNTHDRDGRYREEIFGRDKKDWYTEKVWDAHGDIVHMLNSDKPMSFDELLTEIRSDSTNYTYHPRDLDIFIDGSPIPDPKDVALSLVRLLEVGFVELVDETEYDYLVYIDEIPTLLQKTNREGVVAFISGYRETSHEIKEFSVEELELGTKTVRDSFYV